MVSQKAKSHRGQNFTESKVCHSQQGLAQGMVSHLKQRHGFTEHKVSHVELRSNSHRRQGLTEGRASQNARSHRKQGLTEGLTL